MDLFDLDSRHSWDISSLPWDLVPIDDVRDGSDLAKPDGLDQRLKEAIEKIVGQSAAESHRSHAASVAFIYLYMCIAGKQKT